uniref:F-box domain-containing protein n=1 Tax=Hanusia phi TaxID=3032 RepID=A0A7S0EGH6_9CRYP
MDRAAGTSFLQSLEEFQQDLSCLKDTYNKALHGEQQQDKMELMYIVSKVNLRCESMKRVCHSMQMELFGVSRDSSTPSKRRAEVSLEDLLPYQTIRRKLFNRDSSVSRRRTWLIDLPDSLINHIYSFASHMVIPHMVVCKKFRESLSKPEAVSIEIKHSHAQQVTCKSLEKFQSGVSLKAISCDGFFRPLADALNTGWTALVRLDLVDNHLENKGIIELARSLSNCRGLTSLCLNGNNFTEEGAIHIGRCLQSFSGLKTLNLNQNPFGRVGMEHICEGLTSSATCLRELCLGQTCFGEEGAQNLSRKLTPAEGQQGKLRSLDLCSCNLKSAGVSALRPLLLANPNLESIALSRNDICEKGASILAECVGSQLVDLSLSFNEIGDEGIRSLIPLLERSRRMMHLLLIGIALGSDGGTELLPVLLEMRTLRSLCLSLNLFGPKFKSHLAGSLRHHIRNLHL